MLSLEVVRGDDVFAILKYVRGQKGASSELRRRQLIGDGRRQMTKPH